MTGETVTQIDHKDTPCWCSEDGRNNKHPDKEQHHAGCTQYEKSYPSLYAEDEGNEIVGMLKSAEAALTRADDDNVVGGTKEQVSQVRLEMLEALDYIERAKIALGWIAD